MQEGTIKLLIALIGAFVSIITAIISTKRAEKKKDREWKKSYQPEPPKQGVVKNTTLMVGLGRVGKTQLLKTIVGDSDSRTQHILNISDDFRIVKHIVNNSKKIIHYFTDYRGQNFSQLIAAFIQEQLKPNTPLRYGDINTLLLIVDLFPQEEGGRDELNRQYSEINLERITEHIDTWNSIALDAVFGLLTRQKLKSVFIFVNKIDKYRTSVSKREVESEIRTLFKPLIDNLEIRAENSGADFEFIIGSAVGGENITGPKSLTAFLNFSALNHK